ncbi:DNA helicase-2/ATP-dependent DNA helicase PcrA [Homoserinimonas aerilata]|uniref:DNA 3'-5' helicase n=1 Tax=Homoserinimonas aerilata TaxID=1162970 RepID=A0A542YH10_9MICO|nr:ATP-dependent DNA helicase [Homoserinimonas aerilata]TQL47385.1 DNA helicase-2/ATP-dependent DNA helicase PcrA [Homoserinimonas aerilata]
MIGADDIADALGMFRPTPQQKAVIESPLEPALVVAGAGSGKTETMANRVLWLLANGHAKPGEILGLTFTRKAAGELAERIRHRIRQLAAAGLMPAAADGTAAYDEFDPPAVSTYNSFANAIFRDNAMLLGREGDGAVLGEASAWQLARSVVLSSGDERLPQLDKSVDSVTKAVLSLSHALSENVVDTGALDAMVEEFAAIAELPPGGRGAYAEVDGLAGAVGALPVLLGLAERYAQAKLARGFVEYSDQVTLALEIIRRVPKVAAEYRERYRVVLLDEYQDTSVVQTWLLSEMFAGHPVMAVGDPNQSIYGWRGASAANLEEYAAQFGGGRVLDFALSTSWRNGHDILSVANTLVEPLLPETRVHVEKLRAGPAASAVPVTVTVHETLAEEADAAALWLKARLADVTVDDDGVAHPPTAAMLFRARRTQAAFIEALRRHEVPFHVLGISGLMAEPEIADLVSALSVIGDPSAGSELVRLLAGSRWSIGVRDLKALERLAARLRDRDLAQQPLSDEVRQKLRDSVADGEGGSIVDALDFLATVKGEHGLFGTRELFTETGLERLADAGALFARLRSRAGLDLLDFVTLVEQELMLDIETAANDSRPPGRAGMEAFLDALSGYLAIDDTASLGGFLSWLREADWRDGLGPRPEDAEEGTVQILTIHGSKGLEWDVVVVPRMVEDELPGKTRDAKAWLGFGQLPYQFRGDAAELPDFEWRAAETRKDVIDRLAQFKADVTAHHEKEERRLAYVAVTRARHELLLTASFWAGQNKARRPSPYLRALVDAGVITPLPEESEHEEAPDGGAEDVFLWPLDPLGGRRARVERAASLVRAASVEADPESAGRWQTDIELLLEERRRRLARVDDTIVPSRVPASRFKDYVTDPQAVLAALRRPMPEKPYRATRLGTLFHEWVEDRYGMHGATEMLDAFDGELDTDTVPLEQDRLLELQATFERSPWATLSPIDVEREIHLPLADRVIICKLDAVYQLDDAADGTPRYQVVDWKTGKAPRDAQDLEDKQLQLALYRQAYAEWKGVDPQQIDAVFYFVADDAIIRPERLFDRKELERLWSDSRVVRG